MKSHHSVSLYPVVPNSLSLLVTDFLENLLKAMGLLPLQNAHSQTDYSVLNFQSIYGRHRTRQQVPLIRHLLQKNISELSGQYNNDFE